MGSYDDYLRWVMTAPKKPDGSTPQYADYAKSLMGGFVDAVAAEPTPAAKATAKAAAPAAVQAANTPQQDSLLTTALESGGTTLYSMANSALFGLPGAAAKAFIPDVYKKLEDLRAKYPVSRTVGDVGGMFLPTGGALFKGAGRAAQLAGLGKVATGLEAGTGVARALDTAGDIVKGTKAVSGVGGAAGRGALSAAEQVVPRVLTGQETPEGGALSLGLGAGLGAAGYGLGKVLSAPLRGTEETLDKMAEDLLRDARLAGAGVDTRKMRAALREYSRTNPLGLQPERVDDFKDALADMFARYKVGTTELSRRSALARINADWSKFDDAVDSVGVPGIIKRALDVADDVDDASAVKKLVDEILANDPEAQRIIRTQINPEWTPEVASPIITKARAKVETALRGARNYGEMSKTLGKYARQSVDLEEGPEVALRTVMAKAAKKALDPLADDVAAQAHNIDVKQLRRDYPAAKMLRRILTMDEMTMNQVLKSGSDTASRQAVTNLLSGKQLGILGGTVAGAPQVTGGIKDIMEGDEEGGQQRILAGLGTAAAGTVGGQVLNRLATGAGNKLIGVGANLLANNKLSGAATQFGEVTAPRLGALALQGVGKEPEAPAPEATPAPGSPEEQQQQQVQKASRDAYYDFVEQRLWDQFLKGGRANSVVQLAVLQGKDPAQEVGAAFNEYLKMAYSATNRYDIDAITPYIFDDEKEKATFQRIAKTAVPTLVDDATLKMATTFGGFLGAGRAPENAMTQILIALDAAGVPSNLGGVPLKQYVDNLLRLTRTDPVKQKAALIALIRNQSTLPPTVVQAALAAGGIA